MDKFIIDNKEFTYPENLPENKKELYRDYTQLKIDFDKLDKVIVFPDGKTLKLPNSFYKRIISAYPIDIQQVAFEKVKDVYDRLAILMQYSRRISKAPGRFKEYKPETFGAEIIELLGRDYTTQEVHRIFAKKHRRMAFNELVSFAHHNKDKIRQIRDKWREEYTDVSISAKRTRLEKLDFLLGDLLILYNDASNPVKPTLSKEIRGVLEQARKEVEGDEIKLTVSGRIDVDATITHYMQDSRAIQGLTIHQIVISRVAARLGLPSRFLLDKLANSFYSKFNGFRRNEDLSTKILYPSSVNYDILELESKNKAYNDSMQKIIQESTYEEVKPGAMEINKEVLKNKINELLKQKTKREKEVAATGGDSIEKEKIYRK